VEWEAEPIWLTRQILEAIHADQIREHGGGLGLRDARLLESALAQPRQRFHCDRKADLARLAAEYGFALAKNHAFVDGNKRVAFIAANVFLILNRFEIVAPEPAVVETMQRVADGRMGRDELAAWIRSVLQPCGSG